MYNIYINYKDLLTSEQYGFGQLMSEGRLIVVNSHLTKPFPISPYSKTQVLLGNKF